MRRNLRLIATGHDSHKALGGKIGVTSREAV
jgi:hypothetical protein